MSDKPDQQSIGFAFHKIYFGTNLYIYNEYVTNERNKIIELFVTKIFCLLKLVG